MSNGGGQQFLDAVRMWFKNPNIIATYMVMAFHTRDEQVGCVQFGAEEQEGLAEKKMLDFLVLMQHELDDYKERAFLTLRTKQNMRRVEFDKILSHARAEYENQLREQEQKKEKDRLDAVKRYAARRIEHKEPPPEKETRTDGTEPGPQ